MLSVLPSVIGCYRVLSVCMWSTHTGLHIYVTQCYRMLSSVINVTRYVCGLHICYPVLSDVIECYQCYPLYMYAVYTHRPAYNICYLCYPVLSDVTECYQCYPLCMWSTHTGLHIYVTNVIQCYRMLPSVINVTHSVCGLHTQACIYMLPMLEVWARDLLPLHARCDAPLKNWTAISSRTTWLLISSTPIGRVVIDASCIRDGGVDLPPRKWISSTPYSTVHR